MKKYVSEIKDRIPDALYNSISAKLWSNQCCSDWQCCLECISEMADVWKEARGKDLIWGPGHLEEEEKLLTQEELEELLMYYKNPPFYAKKSFWENKNGTN